MKKEKIRKMHFKKRSGDFCFENLVDKCPITGNSFYLKRKYMGKHKIEEIPAAECYCSECGAFLFVEKKRKNKRVFLFASQKIKGAK